MELFSTAHFCYSSVFIASSVSPAVSLDRAISELLVAKKNANLSTRYIGSLREYLSLFAKGRHDQSVNTFSVSDLDAWFAQRNEALTSRAANMGRLSSLFSFCVRRGYRADNPCERLEHVRLDPVAPRILTIDEATTLLRTCREQHPDSLAYLVIGLFCGLRPGELAGLRWADVGETSLTVNANTSKVRHRRVVEIPGNARDWLRLCPRERVAPRPTTLRRRRAELAQVIGGWPQDLLRHTAASYLLAHHGDAGRVAMMLGNSAKILLTHYWKLTTAEDARRFFEIRP